MDDIKSKLDKIDVKLDRCDQRLDKIDIGNTEMKQDLKYHIKRTDMLEDILLPIKTRHDQIVGMAKFAGAVGTVVGLIEGAIKIFF